MAELTRTSRRSLGWPTFMMLGCLFLWASLLTFDAGDWPSPNQYPHNDPTVNACGSAGSLVAYHCLRMVGGGVYPLVLCVTCGVFLWLLNGCIVGPWQRIFGVAMLVVCTAASLHLVGTPGPNTLQFGQGGLVGTALGSFLDNRFSNLGSILVLTYGFIIGLLFTAEGWVLRLPALVKRAAQASGGLIAAMRPRTPAAVAATAALSTPGAHIANTIEDPLPRQGEPMLRINPGRRVRRKRRPGKDDQPTLFDDQTASTSSPHLDSKVDRRKQVQTGRREGTKHPGRPSEEAPGKQGSSPASQVNRHQVVARAQQSPPDAESAASPPARAYPQKLAKWKLPPLSMLDSPKYTFSAAQESLLRAKAKTLERSLGEFRLDARVVEIDTGPVITMFELELAAGIKVSQIAALANDIARALKAPAVRIVAPIPGKNTIGIEVPNVDKEVVRLKEIILGAEDRIKEMAIPLCLGKDASGNALAVDLASMPHLLIAGTTGSGKSVAINAIVMSLLMTRRPDMVKLILIDPKMVELSHFKDVPHLMSPIITDMPRAEQILDWTVTKMEERYGLLAEARVRNISGYNKLGAEQIYERFQPSTESERQRIPTYLPYIVVIIDELADLMMTSAKEVEHHLSRLAQKSRAVGIHIIVATQRPEAKIVTGLIKSNLPCRCAFRVASRMDSRIVLDQNGAEVLMGQGDMLFLPPGSHKPIRAQGTFVEEHELRDVISFLTSRGRPDFHPELIRARGRPASATERDPLFDQAVDIVLETNRGSVSLLQRRLTIGYSRASRLIDQMAAGGIVGDYKGSQAREVIMTPEDWAVIRKEVTEEMKTSSVPVNDQQNEAVAAIDPPSVVSASQGDTRTVASPGRSSGRVGRPTAADGDDDELDDDDDDDDLDDDDDDDDDDVDDDEEEDDDDSDDDHDNAVVSR